MNPQTREQLGRELAGSLSRLESLHRALADLVERKIDRMRAADVEGLNACTGREQSLVEEIGEQERFRRLLTDRLGRSYGMTPQKARRLTVGQWADKLPAAQAAELRAVAVRLRDVSRRIERRNRVAGALSGEMLRHLGAVLGSVNDSGGAAGGYNPCGQVASSSPRRLFETVG